VKVRLYVSLCLLLDNNLCLLLDDNLCLMLDHNICLLLDNTLFVFGGTMSYVGKNSLRGHNYLI
jgi:hypothetical protein